MVSFMEWIKEAMSRMARPSLNVVWLLLAACIPIAAVPMLAFVSEHQVFLPLVAKDSQTLSCETLTETVWVRHANTTEQYRVVDCLNVDYWPMTIEHTDIVEIWGQWAMMTDMQVLVWGVSPFVITVSAIGGE